VLDTDEDQGGVGLLDPLSCGGHGLLIGVGTTHRVDREGQGGGLLGGHILREFDMHGTRALTAGLGEGFPHDGRDASAPNHLLGLLGNGPHHPNGIDDLEVALLAGVDGLLAGDHAHGHGPELGVGSGGHQVGGAGAQGGETDPGDAREAADGGGHEACTLLVTGEDQLDVGVAQGLQEVQILLTGHPEDILHPFVFQALDQEITGFHGHESPHTNGSS